MIPALIVGAALAATAPAPGKQGAGRPVTAVPFVKGTIRNLYVWKEGGILLIPTVSDGAWYWRASAKAPEPQPLPLGQIARATEWQGALYLATEKGLYRWDRGAPAPVPVEGAGKQAFRLGEWGDRLLAYLDDGLYGVTAAGSAERVGKDKYFWAFAQWQGSLWYGNLDGLHRVESPTAAPTLTLSDAGGVEWLVPDGPSLYIGTRAGGTYQLKDGQRSPTRVADAIGFFRSQASWAGTTLVGTDEGLWDLHDLKAPLAPVKNVWGGFTVWGERMLIGTNSELLVLERGSLAPKSVLPHRIASVTIWNDTAVISTTYQGIWVWRRQDPAPRQLPVRLMSVDSFAAWRGGLLLGLDDRGEGSKDGTLLWLDERMIRAGTAPRPAHAAH